MSAFVGSEAAFGKDSIKKERGPYLCGITYT